MHHCCCCGNGLYTYCTKKAAYGVCKAKEEKVYLQSQQEKLKSSKEDIDGIYGEKLTAFTNLQSEYQEFELEMSLPTFEDLETQSLNLAMDTIKELSRSIYLEKGRKIRIRASQIFRNLQMENI